MEQPKHIALLCNPTLPKAIAMADAIANELSALQISFSIFTAYWPKVWTPYSEAWIVGGDGSLNCFINQNQVFHLPIGIFPGGTGNDFFHALHGEKEMPDLLQTFLNPHTRRIDAGKCNGKLFINGVGIGFDGAVVKSLQGKQKSASPVYMLAIMKHIISYREKPFQIVADGDAVYNGDSFMISIANGKRYGGSFQVAPKAVLDDGLLDLLTVGKIKPASRVRYLPVIEKGEHLELPFVQYKQATKIYVEAMQDIHAHMDGEYFLATAFEVEVLPERFTFLV